MKETFILFFLVIVMTIGVSVVDAKYKVDNTKACKITAEILTQLPTGSYSVQIVQMREGKKFVLFELVVKADDLKYFYTTKNYIKQGG